MSGIATARIRFHRLVCGAMIGLYSCGLAAAQSDNQRSGGYSIRPFASQSIPGSKSPQIIAIGEASHGNEAVLRERNRMIMDLAGQDRISWIALESGYAEARLLDDFVRGGSGTAEDVARRGFTSGFGAMSGNIALLAELRELNQVRPANDRIGIIGIDLSLGGPMGSAPSMAPVECALAGVADASVRQRLHDAFAKAVEPGLTSFRVTDLETSRFRALSQELASSLDARASVDARQCAIVVAQSADVFEALPKIVQPGTIPPDAWLSITRRDRSMAANALAALARSRGKSILLFAHTSHVMSVPMKGGRWSNQTQPPQSMGQVLRERLDERYLAIAQIEPTSRAAGEGLPDLVASLRFDCKIPCMVRTRDLGEQGDTPFRIGVNGDDEQVIDVPAAASFLLVMPDVGN